MGYNIYNLYIERRKRNEKVVADEDHACFIARARARESSWWRHEPFWIANFSVPAAVR